MSLLIWDYRYIVNIRLALLIKEKALVVNGHTPLLEVNLDMNACSAAKYNILKHTLKHTSMTVRSYTYIKQRLLQFGTIYNSSYCANIFFFY
jgi:hypothetical protein